MKQRRWILRVVALLAAVLVAAGTAGADPCPFDLYHSERDTGRTYGELGSLAVLNFYANVFEEEFLARHPVAAVATDVELAERLAPPFVEVAMDLAYEDLLPRWLGREERLWSMASLLLEVVPREALAEAAGGSGTVTVGHGSFDATIVGAALLAEVTLAVYDKVAWGPRFIYNRFGLVYGSTGWFLNGVPVSAAQFDALRAEVDTYLLAANEAAKVELMSGECVAAQAIQHISAPFISIPWNIIFIFTDVITVTGTPFNPELQRFFNGPPGGGWSGGGGGGGWGGPGGGGPRRPGSDDDDGDDGDGEEEDEEQTPPLSCTEGPQECSSRCSDCTSCFECCSKTLVSDTCGEAGVGWLRGIARLGRRILS
ncbi:MAG TPA: hypothetical protein VKU40_15475, partial [Thermoanaerobaculia bacterium]|nr:hypothetical protein [Thermoanaerobaculia bacterium]